MVVGVVRAVIRGAKVLVVRVPYYTVSLMDVTVVVVVLMGLWLWW